MVVLLLSTWAATTRAESLVREGLAIDLPPEARTVVLSNVDRGSTEPQVVLHAEDDGAQLVITRVAIPNTPAYVRKERDEYVRSLRDGVLRDYPDARIRRWTFTREGRIPTLTLNLRRPTGDLYMRCYLFRRFAMVLVAGGSSDGAKKLLGSVAPAPVEAD